MATMIFCCYDNNVKHYIFVRIKARDLVFGMWYFDIQIERMNNVGWLWSS